MFGYPILQLILPGHILSRIVAKIANCRHTQVKNFLIKLFCKLYRVDLTEAIDNNYTSYTTFNDFFTRALREGTRHMENNTRTIVSPVDGKIWQIGQADEQGLIYAKGKGFSVKQLIINNQVAKELQGANFAVLYLAPYNYHRVHMPFTGKLRNMYYIPGKLLSVSPRVAEYIPDVFAKNERVVAIFDTTLGVMAVVFVGAMLVGSVETKWAGVVTPCGQPYIKEWNYQGQEIHFVRGAEIGRFKLGSTVIVLLPKNSINWRQDLLPNQAIQMGQSLGYSEPHSVD